MKAQSLTNRLIGPIAIVISTLLVVILVATKPAPAQEEPRIETTKVSIVPVQSSEYKARIVAQGKVSPRWQSNLSAEVSGRVNKVSDKLLAGASFKRGDILVSIDSVDYQAEKAQAEATLATAEQSLYEEQQRSQRAEQDWKNAGFEGTPSDLVLRKPQLKAALASLKSAKSALQRAEKNLQRTKVRAPYDGVVISRSINPGEIIQAGVAVATIYSTDKMEVALPLNDSQLSLLGDYQNKDIRLTSINSSKQWEGTITRAEMIVDNNNRWRSVMAELKTNDSDHPLAGEFVQATLEGQASQRSFRLPESSLSKDGQIWYVDDKNQLRRFSAQVLFAENADIVVAAPEEFNALRVVVSPLSNFLPGTVVEAEVAPGYNGEAS